MTIYHKDLTGADLHVPKSHDSTYHSVSYIPNSLFDANTILKADGDNTPEKLTVAEQRLVGRITAGVITALTATQVRTLINVENGATADQTIDEILAGMGVLSAYRIDDAVLHSYDDEVNTNATDPVLMKTITIDRLILSPSTLRVSYELRKEGIASRVYGQLKKNGVNIGTEGNITSGSYQVLTQDLEFAEGDTIELWLWAVQSSTPAWSRNFRVHGIDSRLTLEEVASSGGIGHATPFAGTNT